MHPKKKFVSYAQNLEDVMLNRVFKDIDDGFYIDIGACDPVQDSVTNAFYQRGWSGINVEPNRLFFSKLTLARQRDVNLRVAVSDVAGTVNFQSVDGSGISAIGTGAKEIADRLGYTTNTEIVNAVTLDDVFKNHCSERTIRFLKIDVEGHELQVVKGADWQKFRPEVLVIEVVSAHVSSSVNVTELEKILLTSKYVFAWFDGLNRFYVREESSHLLEHFTQPVNIFDHFVLCLGHGWSLSDSSFRSRLSKMLPVSVKAKIRKLKDKILGVQLR